MARPSWFVFLEALQRDGIVLPLDVRLAPPPGETGGAIAHKLEHLARSRSRVIGWLLPTLLLAFVLALALAAVSFFWVLARPPRTTT